MPAALTVIIGFYLAWASFVGRRCRGEAISPFIFLGWSLNALFYFFQKAGGGAWAVDLERLHHALYIWMPLVHLHFFYRWFDLRNDRVERLALGLTLLFFFVSLTPWYVYGVHRYTWGVVADMGPIFYAHLLFSGVVGGYLIHLCRARMRLSLFADESRVFGVITLSMAVAIVLMGLNGLSWKGVCVYTPGNYLFLPMLGLGYVVLRCPWVTRAALGHFMRLWGGLFVLSFLPNLVALYLLHPYFKMIPGVVLFLFFLSWSYFIYRYSRVLRPFIDEAFGRQLFDLETVESHFSENILLLRRTDEMIGEFRRTVEATLHIRGLVFFTRKGEGFLEEHTGRALELSDATHRWLSVLQIPLDRKAMERQVDSREVRRELAALFDQCRCRYIVSLSRYEELLGLVLLPERGDNSPITPGEAHFLGRIKSFVSIALYNSTVYQNLRRLQEELFHHTDALSDEVAERKRAQEIAEQSEKRYRFLADNVLDTIGILRIKPFEFTYLSPSVVKHLGYEAGELVGQDVRKVLTEESEMGLLSLLNQALKVPSGHPKDAFIYETELRRKDGSRVWSEISARFLRGADLKTREIIIVSRDVTERRRLDGEREGLQRRLRQAQKMESIGVLAGGIAHDFNNILMAIMGYTQLALMYISDDNTKARDKIMQIDKAGSRARELVAQILAFSRQNEQRRDLCNLKGLLQDTTGFLSASLPSNIDVNFTLGPGALQVIADRVQIHQIVLNLATNAFHAIGTEGGEIVIGAHEVVVDEALALALHLPEGCYVRLSVADTGHGVDPEIASRIFEPYYTTKEVGKGTGMGLAVVHGIVLNHGGAVSLDSARGQGATFHVYLPWVPRVSDGGGIMNRLGPKGTVLLVDEEDLLIDLAREVLGRLGYQVEAFNDGKKALKVFVQWPKKYVAVVMDLFICGECSVPMLHTIREHAPEMMLVVTSGRPRPLIDSVLGGLDASILMKPFTLKELSEVLEQSMG